MWLGYLEEYPDYRTQGETIEDLEDHLKDIYKELIWWRHPTYSKSCRIEDKRKHSY